MTRDINTALFNRTQLHGRSIHSKLAMRQGRRRLWRSSELTTLRTLARLPLATRIIAMRLGRTERAIYIKASRAGISLQGARAERRDESPHTPPRWRRGATRGERAPDGRQSFARRRRRDLRDVA